MEQVVKVSSLFKSDVISGLNDLANDNFLYRLLHLYDKAVAGNNPLK